MWDSLLELLTNYLSSKTDIVMTNIKVIKRQKKKKQILALQKITFS